MNFSRDMSGLCRRPDFSDEEEDDEEADNYTAAFGSRNQKQTSSNLAKGATIAPPSSLLEDVPVAPGSQSDDASIVEDSEVNSASSKFGM